MAENPEVQNPEDVDALRSMLRTDLSAAMKARQAASVAALRTAIAAIDNAEAVEPHGSGTTASDHIAGAQVGVGSTEAERRRLSLTEVNVMIHAQIADRIAEADRYDDYGRHEAAGRLRREADALRKYVGS